MNILQVLFMIFRYIILGLIIFFLIRYFPNANVNATNATFATIIIILITVSVELFIKFMMSNKSYQETFLPGLQESGCSTCSIENFKNSYKDDFYNAGTCQVKCKEKDDKNKCKITCDG